MNIIVDNPEAIKEYLDSAIIRWRERKKQANEAIEKLKEKDSILDEEILVASCYIDAFQSVRVSLFGELLP